MRVMEVPIKLKRIKGFNKCAFKESAEELKNPGCGFYHIYTLNASPLKDKISLGEEIWFYDNAENESLALALIDIGAFKSSEISYDALMRIDGILDFFRRNKKQIILRFTYDTEGKCLEREPYSKSTVARHIEQTSDLIRRYADDILVNQGLFIGAWGEMHGSKFADVDSVCELADVFYRNTHGKCFLALRTPSQIREVLSGRNVHSGLKDKLALFNDAMFASPTDLGTYAEPGFNETDPIKKQSRERELKWQNEYLAHSPNGGEAAAEENPIGFKEATREMRAAHTSYLNSAFNFAQLDYWKKQSLKDGIWSGISGYDYIKRHLGYRFFVRDVFLGKGKELNIEIENLGFANLTKAAELILTVENKGGAIIKNKLETDPRYWASGQKTVVKTGISVKDKALLKCSLYISLKLQNGTPVFFANEGADERLKIGEFTD